VELSVLFVEDREDDVMLVLRELRSAGMNPDSNALPHATRTEYVIT
jgi:hypothetical protein